MTNDDERGEGVKNAENLMTSYVNDPLNNCKVLALRARSAWGLVKPT